MDNISPNKIEVVTNPSRITKRIVHFGSQYMWLNWGQHMSKENKFITSFFHGKPEDGDDVRKHIDQFLKSVPRLSKIITASTLIEKRLQNPVLKNLKLLFHKHLPIKKLKKLNKI